MTADGPAGIMGDDLPNPGNEGRPRRAPVLSALPRPRTLPAAAGLAGIVILGAAWGIECRRGPTVFHEGQVFFADPDDYMRLYRARRIVEGVERRVDFLSEINWPRGAALHWTAPMDYLIVAAAWCGGAGARGDRFEHVAAWMPVALGLVYLAGLIVLLGRACGWGPALLAGALVAATPAWHRAFALGHPDHHCLLELLSLFAVLLWLPARRRNGPASSIGHSVESGISPASMPATFAVVASGMATGLAWWVAPQAMAVWLAILLGGTWAAWTAPPRLRPEWARRLRAWCAVVLAVVVAGTVVEGWPALDNVRIDRIGWFHAALAGLAMLIPARGGSDRAGATRNGNARRGPARWAAFSIAAATIVIVVAWRRNDVFATVSPPAFYRWSASIAELQPLWARAAGRWSLTPMHERLGYLPYALPVLLAFFWRGARGSEGVGAAGRASLALLAVGFTALSIAQRRWLDHVNLGLTPVTAVGAWSLATRVTAGRRQSVASGEAGVSTLRAVVACAFIGILAFPATRAMLAAAPESPHPEDLRALLACRAVAAQESRHSSPPERRAILADDSVGAVLLYRTGLPVVAVTYHRAIEGIVESARFFAERDESAAREQLRRLGVRYVVVPYRAHEALMAHEFTAFGELRSYDPPVESIDEHGVVRQALRYRPEIARTMAYRLAMEPGRPLAGLRAVATIREGAGTADGMSGLVYVVEDGP